MHYYQFNIADYRKDTVHLLPIEHYIYRTLIDWYYLDESPIPKETQVVMRRLGVGFENETHLLNVLQDFFILGSKGWEHKRIKMEIVSYHEQCEKNRANGKQGGRPKKTQVVTTGNPNESQKNPNQEPLTNNHKPLTNLETESMSTLPSTKIDKIPYQEIVNLYHEILPTLPKVMKLTAKRKGQIGARWKSGDLPDMDTWRQYFEVVGVSPFLMGQKDPENGFRRFKADLEWLTNESNFTKVWEQKYHG